MAKKPTSAVSLDPSMRIAVLYGDERFLIEEHTRLFVTMLDEKFGGIEQFSFDGETADPAAVLDELRSYGLMQRHKLVILDNAEMFLAGGRGADEDDEDEAASAASRRPVMERYAAQPVADATLLMRARTWRKGKLDKLIEKAGGTINQCSVLSESKAADWCMKRCARRYDTTLQPAAAQLLVERLGSNLLHLDTELLKLAAMAGPGQSISRDLVVQSVGLSREEKAWEIQAAIATADAAVMLRKLRELIDISRQDEVPITWAICDLLRKLHTASQLLKQRVPPAGVMKQAKLWGPTVNAMLELAKENEPEVFAQLLHRAIQTDQRAKSGQGDPQRSLEGLLVQIADRLRPLAA